MRSQSIVNVNICAFLPHFFFATHTSLLCYLSALKKKKDRPTQLIQHGQVKHPSSVKHQFMTTCHFLREPVECMFKERRARKKVECFN